MMVKFAILVFAVLQCAVLTMGAVAHYPVSTHPDHPGKCWFEDDKKAYAVGEKWSQPDSCGRFSCNDDYSATYVTCGVIAVDPDSGYTISGIDVSKPYPECCPQIIKP